jgi:hypothetical protein
MRTLTLFANITCAVAIIWGGNNFITDAYNGKDFSKYSYAYFVILIFPLINIAYLVFYSHKKDSLIGLWFEVRRLKLEEKRKELQQKVDNL